MKLHILYKIKQQV